MTDETLDLGDDPAPWLSDQNEDVKKIVNLAERVREGHSPTMQELAELLDGFGVYSLAELIGVPVEVVAETLGLSVEVYENEEIAGRLSFYIRYLHERLGVVEQIKVNGLGLADLRRTRWSGVSGRKQFARVLFTYWWLQEGRDRDAIVRFAEPIGVPAFYTDDERALIAEILSLLENAHANELAGLQSV